MGAPLAQVLSGSVAARTILSDQGSLASIPRVAESFLGRDGDEFQREVPTAQSQINSSLYIGKTRSADQDESVPLILGKLAEGLLELLEFHVCLLGRLRLQRFGVFAFAVLDFAPPLPIVGSVIIAGSRITTPLSYFRA